MKLLETVFKGIDRVTVFFGVISGCLGVLLTLVVFSGVVSRYGFDFPLGWRDEIVAYIYVGSCLFALGYATYHRSHVAAETLYVRFPARLQFAVRIAGYALAFACCAIVIYYGTSITWTYFVYGWRSDTPYEILLWPVMITIPFGFLLFALECVSQGYGEIKKVTEEGFTKEKEDA